MLVHTCSSVAGSRQKISYIVCGATPYFSSTGPGYLAGLAIVALWYCC